MNWAFQDKNSTSSTLEASCTSSLGSRTSDTQANDSPVRAGQAQYDRRRQTGHVEGRGIDVSDTMRESDETTYQHSVQNFERMWKNAGQETRAKWSLWTKLIEWEGMKEEHGTCEGLRKLRFEVTWEDS